MVIVVRVALTLVLLMLPALLAGCGSSQRGGVDAPAIQVAATPETSAVPVSKNDPSWGSPVAPVTWVLYSDFACPFCSRLVPVMEDLQRLYGPASLRIVWKHHPLPMHPNARPLHAASEAVFRVSGSAGFWRFHNLAFSKQDDNGPDAIVGWAETLGVDRAAFLERWVDPDGLKKIEADVAEGVAIGVDGTPASFINGTLISGAMPLEDFKKVIDAELKAVNGLRAQGVLPESVYAARVATNFVAPPKRIPQAPGESPEEDEEDRVTWFVPVGSSPSRGSTDALVTMVVFSEFECPFCARIEPTLEELLAAYKNDLRVVWKHQPLPFHEHAMPAARLAQWTSEHRGASAFWALHKLLFDNQTDLETSALIGYGKQAGLTEKEAKMALEDARLDAGIEADMDLAADLGVRGTPCAFINGRRVVGAQPVEVFRAAIDAALVEAQEVASRVGRASTYAELMKDARKAPPSKRVALSAPAGAPRLGPRDSTVTIQVISDFQCPFCKRVGPTMHDLQKAFPKEVALVWRHHPLPFHADAMPAHEAAQEAFAQKGDKAFWRVHDALFGLDSLTKEAIEAVFVKEKLSVPLLRTAWESGKHRALIQADTEAVEAVGMRGTPAFSVNGIEISGAQPLRAFKRAVRQALAEASQGK